MNQADYYAGEFTDEFLHAQADAGDFLNYELRLYNLPSQEEMKALAVAGEAILLKINRRSPGCAGEAPGV